MIPGLNWLQAGLGAFAGAALMFGALSAYHHAVSLPAARQEGRELERTAALERFMEIIRERSATDAEIGRMSDADLCRALGGVFADGQCQ